MSTSDAPPPYYDAPPSYYQATQLTTIKEISLEEITIEKLRETAEVNRSEASGKDTFVRVPQKLYDIDSEAYVPHVVSLGLFHHPGYGSYGPNNVNVLAMEGYKQEGMLRLLDSTIDPEKTLANCKTYVKRNLNKISGCYNEKMDISGERVGSIVLVDACFLLDFFLHRMDLSFGGTRVITSDYSIFWAMRRDATLLENQIPIFVINELLHIISGDLKNPIDDASRHIYRNILSLVRLTPETPQLTVTPQFSDSAHLLDLVNMCHLSIVDDAQKSDFKFPQSLQNLPRTVQLRTVTQLHAAGVRFKRADGINLLALKFNNGCLEIPALVIHDSTARLLINLLAYEHLSFPVHPKDHIASYVMLMMHLVETKEDLKLLEKEGIILNELGSKEDCSKIFFNISKHAILGSFYFKSLCQDIEIFAKSHRRRYKRDFKKLYLRNPWTFISLLAAVLLLVLTTLQTVYTIIPFYRNDH